MQVRYWQPLREMETMRRQFDQLVDELTRPTDIPMTWQPAIEIQETQDVIIVRAQLPGIDLKDLEVEVTPVTVSLAGERTCEQKTGAFKSEFRYGKFHRIISLPSEVQNDQVQAEYKDGIMTLTLPKKEARNQVVKVNLTNLGSSSEA